MIDQLRKQEEMMTKWAGHKEFMVSICCATYNHEKYIAKALDSFLMQELKYLFEILINDDASTDNAASIIKEYEHNYPSIIKPIYQIVNQKSKLKSGMNPRFNYPRAKGRYIALCDGDDYWIDPYKLQKQVDFLEKNNNFSFCHHGFMLLDQKKSNVYVKQHFKKKNISPPDYITSFIYYLNNKNVKTLTVVFRRNIISSQNKKLIKNLSKLKSGDYYTFLMLLALGPGYYIPEEMGVYRFHIGGITNNKHRRNNLFYKYIIKVYPFIKERKNKLYVLKFLLRKLVDYLRLMKLKIFIEILVYLLFFLINYMYGYLSIVLKKKSRKQLIFVKIV